MKAFTQAPRHINCGADLDSKAVDGPQVTLRMSPREARQLDAIVERWGLRTRAAAVRELIRREGEGC